MLGPVPSSFDDIAKHVGLLVPETFKDGKKLDAKLEAFGLSSNVKCFSGGKNS